MRLYAVEMLISSGVNASESMSCKSDSALILHEGCGQRRVM